MKPAPLIPKKILIPVLILIVLSLGLLVYFKFIHKTDYEKMLITVDEYYAAGANEEAFNILQSVMDRGGFPPEDENYYELYLTIGDKLYEQYLSDARNFADESDFKASVENYEKLLNMLPSSHEKRDEIREEMKQVEVKLKKQESLDEFSRAFTPIFNESNRILVEVSNEIDELYIGNIKINDFVKTMKGYVSETGSLRTEVSQSVSKIPNDLMNIYNSVSSWVNNLHDFVMTASDISTTEEIQSLISIHNSINRSITETIHSIESYAESNGLQFQYTVVE